MLISYWWLRRALKKEYVTQFIDMQKLTVNIWKIVIKESRLNYWDVNNLYAWTSPQKHKFELIEDTSQFNKNFIKNCEEKDE